MQKLVAVAIVLIAALGGYLFWTSSAPDSVPVETEEAPLDEATVSAARAHIADLTSRTASGAIPIGDADNFVTEDQLLQLPQNPGEQASITSVDSGAASARAIDLGLVGTTAEVDSQTLPDLNQLRLKELLNNPDPQPGDVFYIHAVDNYDRQGLWGILQRGLTATFAKGIKLSGQNRTLSTQIPEDADERLADRSSSFLGRILDDKVRETLVYNYRQGLLGQDPDLIQPGQQLLIIRFSEDELIRIYNHFANQQP